MASPFRDLSTSPAAYIREQRLERARRSLGDPRRRDFAMAAVAAQCGFTDTTTFTRAFRRAYDVTSAEFRSTGRTARSSPQQRASRETGLASGLGPSGRRALAISEIGGAGDSEALLGPSRFAILLAFTNP